jgi:hypothetical protein
MGKKLIDDICEKEWSRLFLLRRDNHLIDINSLIRLYVGFIGHVLEYGDVVNMNIIKYNPYGLIGCHVAILWLTDFR